jgi:hypothetical protein
MTVSNSRYLVYKNKADKLHCRVVRRLSEHLYHAPKKNLIVRFLHANLPLFGDKMPDRGKIVWQLPSSMTLSFIYKWLLREEFNVGSPLRIRWRPEWEEDSSDDDDDDEKITKEKKQENKKKKRLKLINKAELDDDVADNPWNLKGMCKRKYVLS